ncbi:MAG: lipid-A-disaccharide synthase N-terminal domain-containing protein [Planctomycetota bacterium]
MNVWAWIGWLGNIAFFSRFFVQWLASERAGHSVAPRSFWWLSLTGSLSLGGYTFVKGEPVLLAGHVLNGLLFARNLMLSYRPRTGGSSSPLLGVLAATLISLLVFLSLKRLPEHVSPFWLAMSLGGQLIWTSRFVLQWLASERRGESHFPVYFWWLSLLGNGMLLAYASHLGDPILIAGYLPGPLVQARNLMLGPGKRDEPAEGM